jgi:branched-chain amino acid transport system permease protein
MLDEIAIVVVRGIGLGSIFAVMAMGFNLVYNSSGILNFAQGNLFILGGFAAFTLLGSSASAGWWLLGLPVAAALIALVFLFQGWLTLLPLRDSTKQESWLISTMAFSIIVGAVLLLTQGPFERNVPSVFPGIQLLGMQVPSAYGLAFAAMIVWYAALKWFLSRTLTGLAISALSQDVEAARAAGLRVRRLQLLSFVISGLVVGSAGFIAAPVVSISATSGVLYLVNGFIATVVGGMGSNLGALIAGPLVGISAMIATYQFGGEYQNLVSLLLLVGILLLRPQGLLGRSSARRV